MIVTFKRSILRFNIQLIIGLIIIFALGIARVGSQAPFFPSGNDILVAAWNEADTRLATGHANGTVKIWNISTGQPIATLTGHVGSVIAIAWNSSGNRLATGGADMIIRIWDTPLTGSISNTPIKQLVGHTDAISALTWTTDGKLISGSSSDQQNLRIWDATSGNQISGIDSPSITNFAWSPGRDYLAFGSVAGYTGFINGTTLALDSKTYGLQSISGDKGIQALAWSPTGSQIAAANLSGEILIWNRSTDSQLTTLQANTNTNIFYYTSSVFALKYSSNGTKLMAVSADGTLRTWNTSTTSTWTVLQTSQIGNGIYAADFRHDGSKIAYGKQGNAVQITPPAGVPTFTPTSGASSND
jgi:WD40 repeat protein